MAMKMYSAFLKALALLELHHPIIYCYMQDIQWERGSYPLFDMQLVYSSTFPADWALLIVKELGKY